MNIKSVNNNNMSQKFGNYAILKKPEAHTVEMFDSMIENILKGTNILSFKTRSKEDGFLYILASGEKDKAYLADHKTSVAFLAGTNHSRQNFVEQLRTIFTPTVVYEDASKFASAFQNGKIDLNTFEEIG